MVSREEKLKIVGVSDLDPESMRGPTRARMFVPLKFAENLHVMQPADLREISRAVRDKPVYSSINVRVKNPSQVQLMEDAIKKMGFTTFPLLTPGKACGNSSQFYMHSSDLRQPGLDGRFHRHRKHAGDGDPGARRENGIMKAIGASDGDVKKLFFAEAGAMGILGGIVGVAIGWAIGQVINMGTNVYLESLSLPPEHSGPYRCDWSEARLHLPSL